MKKNLLFAALCMLSMLVTARAQNVFNPNDPIVNYNPASPPAIPPPNTLAKWVRTPRPEVGFNTERYKSYYYNGMPFRLRFPNGYNPSDPNKKYPVVLFFHGIGEAANDFDNEINLLYSGPNFEEKINAGLFDAFLLFPATDFGDWSPSFANINSVLDLLQLYCRADPDRLITMGLSLGGDGTMKYTFEFPQRSAVSIPSSPGSIITFTQNPAPFVHIPIWVASGGLDDQFSTPASVQAFVDRFNAAGGDIRWSFFPQIGHGTWVEHWNQPNLLAAYWNAAHKANPLVFFKTTNFPANTPFSVKIGITGGFAEYQWQKDNVAIPGAGGNEIMVSQPGSYRVRFRRSPGGAFSDWSPNPAVITQPPPTDNVPPSAPANLHVVSATTTSVTLDWDNSTDNVGVTGYDIYVNGVKRYSAANSAVVADNLNPATTYTFSVQARDLANNFSAFSNSVGGTTATPPDVTPPSTPANLRVVSVSTNSVSLDWDNSTDNVGVTGYDIFVNGTKQYSSANSEVVATGLSPATNYSFTVQARDLANNFSAFSNAINGTTASVVPPVDNIPPSAPGNLRVVSTNTNSVTLDWDNSTDNVGVTGYDVFVNGNKQYSTVGSDIVAGNLNPSTTYLFTVQARDLANNFSGFSNPVSGTTTNVIPPVDNVYPGAPGNLRVVSVTNNSITLDWDNSVDNVGIAGYDVFINGAKTYATVNSDYVVGNLGANTTYTFRIQAHDFANNYSEFSNQVNGTTTGGTPPVDNVYPGAPGNLRVVSVTNTSVSLDWDNSVDNVGIAGYDVFINGAKTYATVNSDYVVGNLSANTTYNFRVQAHDFSNNYSEFSNLINGTTTGGTPPVDNVYPGAPGNLRVVSVTNNSITLDWDNSVDNVGIAGYDVFINGAKTYATVNSDYVVGNLGANTTYNFRVQAHDFSNNYSEFSNLINGTTTGGTPPVDHVHPGAPGNLRVVSTTGNSITLDWDNSVDNVGIAGYDVFINGAKTYATVNSDYVVGNLNNNTTYAFRVQAHDLSNNYSEFSNQVNGTTTGTTSPPDHVHPGAPGNLRVVSTTGRSITLDWDNSVDNVGIAGYDVFINGAKTYATVNSDYVVGNLNNNTTYTFRVQAHDPSNNYSEFSNSVNGTTSGAAAGVLLTQEMQISGARLNAEIGNIEMQSVYPNPFANSFTIQFNNVTAGSKISVDMVDVSGRLLFQQNFGNMASGITTLKMNVADKGLIPGLYFARLNINGKPMKLMKLVRK